MLNDNCPFSLWTVIVAAATISVHGGQLSLMDSYRCYRAHFRHSYNALGPAMVEG